MPGWTQVGPPRDHMFRFLDAIIAVLRPTNLPVTVILENRTIERHGGPDNNGLCSAAEVSAAEAQLEHVRENISFSFDPRDPVYGTVAITNHFISHFRTDATMQESRLPAIPCTKFSHVSENFPHDASKAA